MFGDRALRPHGQLFPCLIYKIHVQKSYSRKLSTIVCGFIGSRSYVIIRFLNYFYPRFGCGWHRSCSSGREGPEEGDCEGPRPGRRGPGGRHYGPHRGPLCDQDQEVCDQGGDQVQDQDWFYCSERDCSWSQICSENVQVDCSWSQICSENVQLEIVKTVRNHH